MKRIAAHDKATGGKGPGLRLKPEEQDILYIAADYDDMGRLSTTYLRKKCGMVKEGEGEVILGTYVLAQARAQLSVTFVTTTHTCRGRREVHRREHRRHGPDGLLDCDARG